MGGTAVGGRPEMVVAPRWCVALLILGVVVVSVVLAPDVAAVLIVPLIVMLWSGSSSPVTWGRSMFLILGIQNVVDVVRPVPAS